MMKFKMVRLLVVLMAALLCGQQVAAAATRPDDQRRSDPARSRRELQGMESNLAPETGAANVTTKGIWGIIAKAALSWGAEKLIEGVWQAVTSSGESQASEAYRYTFKVKTSCNDGAATDGSLYVKIRDSNDAYFQTGNLDIEGKDDRELCSLDTYETDGVEWKVLLNSDTVCRVYFNPRGDNPKWEPEYIKISRSSDSSDTKGATFCNNNGVLGEEGWYTFDHCS